jgi:acetyl esterase/lipase
MPRPAESRYRERGIRRSLPGTRTSAPATADLPYDTQRDESALRARHLRRGLPDALIITDDDILQDEGEEYAGKLAQAGVRVTAVRYNQTIHDFAMLNPLADTPAARGAIQQAISTLRGALHA